MGNAMPTFSILIPTHRRAQRLRRCLESLQAQTFTDYQIIVVSDIGDAESAAVAEACLRDGDCFVRRHGNPGPAASRNLALALAQGERVLFLDDDDIFQPQFLTQVASCLPALSATDIVYTNFEVIHEDGSGQELKREAIDVGPYPWWWVYVKNFIPNNCVVYPRQVLQDVRFDTVVAYEDWDFLLAAARHGALRHLPIYGPGVYKNQAEDSRGDSNNSRLLECYIHIYNKYPPVLPEVERQRAQLFASIGVDIGAYVKTPAPGC